VRRISRFSVPGRVFAPPRWAWPQQHPIQARIKAAIGTFLNDS